MTNALHATRRLDPHEASVSLTSLLPGWLLRELRSNHAGETGAVWIYRGILAVSRAPEIQNFAQHHLATERNHLREIEGLLAPENRSRLIVLWRIAGFITGALPAFCGPRAVFHTIEVVETFVDQHYQQQINRLQPLDELSRELATVRAVLVECQADEVAHRDEAAQNAAAPPGPLARLWCAAVAYGSGAAVALARKI